MFDDTGYLMLNSLLLGRPYGDCGVIFRKTLLVSMKLLISPFRHFCAISLNSTIIIAVYFPTDYRTSNSDDDFLLWVNLVGLSPHNFMTTLSLVGISIQTSTVQSLALPY